jgi:hypothetical protein
MEQVMTVTHICEKGDSLPKIAAEYGFSDYHTIWDLPDNAELRTQRPNPNVLAAGDRLIIPDKQDKQLAVTVGAKHAFTLKGKATRLRLQLLDLAGAPLKSTPIQITVDGKTSTVSTDATGLLDQPVPPGAPSATLFADAIGTLEVQIGHLDPVDQRSGLLGRLYNLGYVPGLDELTVDAAALRFGIELFQADHQLAVDGDDTASVEAKLKETYGC